MKNRNIFWGLFFIVAAVLVIALQFGSFVTVGFWTIAATVLLVGWIIKSLTKLDFGSLPFPIALLYLLYQKPLGLLYIKPWLLLVAAMLLGIGLSMVLGGLKRRSYNHYVASIQQDTGSEYYSYDGDSQSYGALDARENNDDNFPEASVRFGAVSKYLHSSNLETGRFESSFGALEVYFDQATLSPNGADIFLDCSLGAISLYIPRHWQVINDVTVTLAGVDESKRNRPAIAPDAPQLRLHGHVSLGGVEIKYV